MAGGLVCGTAVLCFRAGGYFHDPRTAIAIGASVVVAVVAISPLGPALIPPTRAGRVALAGLVALAGWTALSLLWAPLIEPAREDAQRLALYVAALALAVVALRERWAVRAVEAAVALLAVGVVAYGLLGEAGAIDVTASASANGRLDQPLGYWNAMGAMAALGVVLAVRIAVDRGRPIALRTVAAIGAVPPAVGLYLTYSRGALAAAIVGLAVLALVAPETASLWRRAGRRARAAASWAVLGAVVVGLVVVAGDRAVPERGATAQRFADLGSNRSDYWNVAAGAFADEPLIGTGTGGFAVVWLRERDVREGAYDAHSLYVETGSELGLVGLLLLAGFVAGTAVCARQWAGNDAALAAGPCAALTVLTFHAGLDWDWELPALVLPALLMAGAAIARDGRPAAVER